MKPSSSCDTAAPKSFEPKPPILITNARAFDGKTEKLADGMSALVEHNKIGMIAG